MGLRVPSGPEELRHIYMQTALDLLVEFQAAASRAYHRLEELEEWRDEHGHYQPAWPRGVDGLNYMVRLFAGELTRAVRFYSGWLTDYEKKGHWP